MGLRTAADFRYGNAGRKLSRLLSHLVAANRCAEGRRAIFEKSRTTIHSQRAGGLSIYGIDFFDRLHTDRVQSIEVYAEQRSGIEKGQCRDHSQYRETGGEYGDAPAAD